MNFCASLTYRKRQRERMLRASLAGVAARERNRMARNADCGEWKRVATLILLVNAAPDGRNVAIQASGRTDWHRCGSERAVRGALARMIYAGKETP